MIAQAHIFAVQRVDEIKVPPHEWIAAVHARETALKYAAPRIKRAPRREAVLLKVIGRHAGGLKRNLVVAVAVIEPPAFVKETALRAESCVEWRAWKWSEMVESRNVKRLVAREFDRAIETFRCIAVVSENERSVNANTMAGEI